jgi:tRNA threonylcarbamoyl adenosine modification protein (Sua5/YciO/YrdC/YwlC family)
MSQFFQIHPKNPQRHLIRAATNLLHAGGVIVYPTDSEYALGCEIDQKAAIDRIRRIRQLDEKHYLTLLCRDLSELSTYANFDNSTFRLLKAHTPGAYTFILRATREVPRRLQQSGRKTIGLRIPNHPVTLALLEALDQPLISSTMILPGAEAPLIEPAAMRDILGNKVDLVIDGGPSGLEPTTIIDLADGAPRIIRHGKGDPTPFI